MSSYDEKLNAPEATTVGPEASRTTSKYRLVFANKAAERDFKRAYAKLPKNDVERIKEAVREIEKNPRRDGKSFKHLKIPINIGAIVANYRWRVGKYRILYDVDDSKKTVVLMTVGRRREDTYRNG